MKRFRLHEPATVEDAVARLARHGPAARPLGAGTDLVAGVMRDLVTGAGMAYPEHLVDLTTVPALAGVRADEREAVIGAATTLTALAETDALRRGWPLLVEAAQSVASPEIRNVATLGGNLHQRPRCWFFRNRYFDCLKKGGDVCYAIEGDNRYNAIVGGAMCYIVNPSDTATALLALGARARVAGPDGERVIPFDDYFVSPADDLLNETVLRPAEVLTAVVVPRPAPGTRMAWRKVNDKPSSETWDFALASVAAAAVVEDGRWRGGRLVLGGVAPVPYRFEFAERMLQGRAIAEVAAVAAACIREVAHPMRDNAYKVDLSETLVRDTLLALVTA